MHVVLTSDVTAYVADLAFLKQDKKHRVANVKVLQKEHTVGAVHSLPTTPNILWRYTFFVRSNATYRHSPTPLDRRM